MRVCSLATVNSIPQNLSPLHFIHKVFRSMSVVVYPLVYLIVVCFGAQFIFVFISLQPSSVPLVEHKFNSLYTIWILWSIFIWCRADTPCNYQKFSQILIIKSTREFMIFWTPCMLSRFINLTRSLFMFFFSLSSFYKIIYKFHSMFEFECKNPQSLFARNRHYFLIWNVCIG